MAIIQSVKPRPHEIMLKNGMVVWLDAYGSATIPDDQIDSPHLVSCCEAGICRFPKEKKEEPAPTREPSVLKHITNEAEPLQHVVISDELAAEVSEEKPAGKSSKRKTDRKEY